MSIPEFLTERRGVAANTEITLPLPIHPDGSNAVAVFFIEGDVTPVGATPAGWGSQITSYNPETDLTYLKLQLLPGANSDVESVTATWTGVSSAAGILVLSPDSQGISFAALTGNTGPAGIAFGGGIGSGQIPVLIGGTSEGAPSIYPTGVTTLTGLGAVTYLDDQYSGVDCWALIGSEVLPSGTVANVDYYLAGDSITPGDVPILSQLFFFQEPANPGPTTVIQTPDRINCIASPVTFGGLAHGEARIESVALRIQRGLDNFYWDGAAWTATDTTVPAVVDNPLGTTTAWSYADTGAFVDPGQYLIEAVGVDDGIVAGVQNPIVVTGGQDAVNDIALQMPQGDFEIEWVVTAVDYSTGALQGVASQYITAGDNRGWIVRYTGTGQLSGVLSSDGLAGGSLFSGTAAATVYTAGVSDGNPMAGRAVFVDNGADYTVTMHAASVADPLATPPAVGAMTNLGSATISAATVKDALIHVSFGSGGRDSFGGSGFSTLDGTLYQLRIYDNGVNVLDFTGPADNGLWYTNGTVTGQTTLRGVGVGTYTSEPLTYCVAGSVATPRVRAPKLGYGHDIVVEVVGRPNGISPGVVLARLPVQTSRGLVDSTRSARTTRGYFERRLDGTSDAEVTATFSPLDLRRCCDDLAVIDDYAHELRVWWDGLIAWVGPITYLEHLTDGIYIQAKDRSTHLDTRALGGHEHTGAALSRVFRDYFLDAYYQDPWGASLIVQDVGVTGDREVSDTEAMIAARAIDELARTGIDWTMVGTKMIVGGQEVPARTLPTLTDHHFTTPLRPVSDGSRRATDFVMSGDQVAGRATLPESDPRRARYGLITGRAQDFKILDTESVAAAAQTRLDFGADPVYLELGDAVLSPKAPVALVDLIPGARVPILAAATCRTVAASFRLSRVRVELSGEVSIQVQPLGTTIPGA